MHPLRIPMSREVHFTSAGQTACILPATGLPKELKPGNDPLDDAFLSEVLSLAIDFLPIAECNRGVLAKNIDVSFFFDERFENPFGILVALENHGEFFSGRVEFEFYRQTGVFFQYFFFDIP